MEPTPGGLLEEINTLLTDPTVSIVARLAKSPRVTEPDAIALADLVECDFPGYTPFVYTPKLTGAQEDEFYAEMATYNVEFMSGVLVTPQFVTCLYVTESIDGQDPRLLGVALFDPPLLVNQSNQVLAFDGTLAAIKELGG